MRRHLAALTGTTYDLLIVGGGIYGATLAWEAAHRGLSVALIEQSDFGAATSANSLKTIHGGLRYLQHADLKRMRESIGERSALMRIAPHLVHPLPVLMPTYGHGLQGREAMAAALLINEVVSFDRNRGLDDSKRIPSGRVISRAECQHLAPGISAAGLTGGALFYDAQVYNSERLTLAFLHSATASGAQVANYVRAIRFLRQGNRVGGVEAEDVLSGQRLDIQARMVINAAGPWAGQLLSGLGAQQPARRPALALAMNIVTRPIFETCAVGVPLRETYHDADALINKGNRLLFVAPWRGRSIIGTSYAPYQGDPSRLQISPADVQLLVEDFNRAYPAAALQPKDVDFVHAGLLPMADVNANTGAVRLTKHYWLHDHRAEGLHGLITVLGVKYTTARDVASKALEVVFAQLERRPPQSRSAHMPLHGGQISNFGVFLKTAISQHAPRFGEPGIRNLVHNYGSAFPNVLRYLDLEAVQPAGLALLQAETRHAVHEEMACTLADVVLRRTELGSAGRPGMAALLTAARTMAIELEWDEAHLGRELENVIATLSRGLEDDNTYRTDLAGATLQQVGAEAEKV